MSDENTTTEPSDTTCPGCGQDHMAEIRADFDDAVILQKAYDQLMVEHPENDPHTNSARAFFNGIATQSLNTIREEVDKGENAGNAITAALMAGMGIAHLLGVMTHHHFEGEDKLAVPTVYITEQETDAEWEKYEAFRNSEAGQQDDLIEKMKEMMKQAGIDPDQVSVIPIRGGENVQEQIQEGMREAGRDPQTGMYL